MTTVIGVDPSLSSTGLVTWRDGRFFVSTVVTLPGELGPARHHKTVMRILAMADPDPGPNQTLVVMEGRINPGDGTGKGTTALDLAELRGVINYGLHMRGLARVDVHPATLKVYATGHGGASKADMLVAARGRLGRHVHVHNDDEADGAWLAAIALHHYGRPLCPLPARNVKSLTKVTWPPFDLGEHR